ncbi:penicillin-binding protein activator [Novosphingobium flavum]|uniref:Penicillin-binding protein activator n=1 Tax=Novosphingobium aerophilum TaxID=2839843 RepID=A0A7X1KCG6_9SPHN|nr:penicillin-binding protein activator [Novosphingobium aerophilum]MBC2652087.1 penicillin-binding protein activator [Novosphingobium aerophilum]MBC2660470.1 penicillin-binding protein activator [Novosphingobium aerophilum]
MFGGKFDRRGLLVSGALALVAGCTVVPKAPPVAPAPEQPSATTLPADQQRHRVALLVPLSGPNAAVGQSLANATTMALLDTGAGNLRLTTYDTAAGPAVAATRAIADGNKLILGPLMGDEATAAAAVALPARVPIIAFSNDIGVASPGTFIMGSLPEQSIARTVRFARSRGLSRFAALVPDGEYGQRAAAAFHTAVLEAGGTVVATETYARGNTSVVSAARRLRTRGAFDAVLIGDSGRFAALAAPAFKGAKTPVRLLGTELWSGDGAAIGGAALAGAWYSAVPDGRFLQFADSYQSRFGAKPYRIATLGYDAVLLTLRVAREWKPGSVFPTGRLGDRGGFLGLDGPFRFAENGRVERAFEVNEVRVGGVTTVSPAPARFQD